MVLLCAGFVAIVATMAREAGLPPGEAPGPAARRRGRIAGAIASAVVAIAVVSGNWWWGAEAANYARYVYKPLEADRRGGRRPPHVDAARSRLDSQPPPRRLRARSRPPDAPVRRVARTRSALASAPGGRARPASSSSSCRLFPPGTTSCSPTSCTRRVCPKPSRHHRDAPGSGGPLTGDDSAFPSPAAGRIVWVRDGQPLVTRRLTMFTFRVEDADGQPARDLELYMGMPGHAVFIRRDRHVFAHVHPGGSAPMAAMEIAAASSAVHVHHEDDAALPATVSFPVWLSRTGRLQDLRAGETRAAGS